MTHNVTILATLPQPYRQEEPAAQPGAAAEAVLLQADRVVRRQAGHHHRVPDQRPPLHPHHPPLRLPRPPARLDPPQRPPPRPPPPGPPPPPPPQRRPPRPPSQGQLPPHRVQDRTRLHPHRRPRHPLRPGRRVGVRLQHHHPGHHRHRRPQRHHVRRAEPDRRTGHVQRPPG